jgi:hypothetical protein
MNPLWSYFWPCFAVGLLTGAVGGLYGFRKTEPRKRDFALALGFLVALGLAALWHGPLGAADRFAATVEQGVQRTLVYYEMTQVTAHLHHDPLTRRVMLSGPADDFQRQGLVQFMDDIPGVASARWLPAGGGKPLILEGLVVALVGYLFGLLLAYLVELRRRYNAQWDW